MFKNGRHLDHENPAANNDIPLEELRDHLQRIELKLDQLLIANKEKDWYTTTEVACILKKAPFTVREWCRFGRIRAEKRECGRGTHSEWMISRGELTRLESEGLLPPPTPAYRHFR